MENKSSGIWKWLVGLLVLCNMALIAIIWFRPQAMHGGPHGRRGPMNFDKELNLSKEQEIKFRAMADAQQVSIDSLKHLAKDVREQFFANINVPAPDTAKIDQLSGQLGYYHRLIELQTYNYFRNVRAILTEEQKVVFDKVIQDVLTRLPEQPRFKGDGQGRRDGPPHREGDHQGPPEDGNGPPPPDGYGPPGR